MKRSTGRRFQAGAIVALALTMAGCTTTTPQASSASTDAFVQNALRSYGIIGSPGYPPAPPAPPPAAPVS